MRRYRVLFMTTWYPTAENRMAGVFVREHARAVQRFDDVRVLHSAGHLPPEQGGWWRVEEETDPSLAEGLPTYRVYHRRFRVPGLSYLAQLAAHWRAIGSIRRAGFEPELIHAHVYNAGALAVLYGRSHGIPVVVSEHSSAFPRRLLSRRRVWEAKLAFGGSERVLPVSQALQRGIEAYGLRGRFQVVPNVVDTELFTPPDIPEQRELLARPVKTILYVGSLLEVKGVDHLLEAVAQLAQERTDWRMVIVGDGPNRAQYQQLATRLGLGDRVQFHGFRPKAEIALLMRRAHLFVLASLWDNLPCVLIEAMASGLPMVATSTGGIPELVDEKIGLLVAPGDSAALRAGLAAMLDTLARYDRCAIARRAQRYSHATVGAEIHSIYASCLP